MQRFELRQADFDKGSYFARQPGIYVFMENIIFNPLPENDYFPTHEQKAVYQPFILGFFAALIIISDDVEIDLNGFKFDQGLEHSLQQRFYAHVNIGSGPFKFGTGPAKWYNSESEYFGVKNVKIRNGNMGLSSHHGILGNDSFNIQISNLKIHDYEIAGIGLNGGGDFHLSDLDIGPSLQKIPLDSTYSAARFIRQFVKQIIKRDSTLTFRGMNGLAILQRLQDRMTQTFRQVIAHGSTDDDLFANKGELNQGTQYGLILGPSGPKILGEYCGQPKVQNVTLERIKIHDLRTNPKHILGLSAPGNTNSLPVFPHDFQVDVGGAQIRIKEIMDPTNKSYRENELTDCQLFCAKNAQNEKESGKNCISMHTVNWAEGKETSPLLHGAGYLAGSDFQSHVSKAMRAIRLEGIQNLRLDDIEITNIENRGHYPSADMVLAGCPVRGHPAATLAGLNSADAIAISLSSCSGISLGKIVVDGVKSWHGNAHVLETNFVNTGIVGQSNIVSSNIESLVSSNSLAGKSNPHCVI